MITCTSGLIEKGAVSWNAVAGGRVGQTLQATSSGPGWASVLTGVWADKHGVTSNAFTGSNFANYPHFFKRLHEVEMTVEMASLVSWGPIQSEIVEDSGVTPICDCHAYTAGSYDQRDADLTAKTVEILEDGDPDVLFHYQGNPDIAGHTWGFSPLVPEYMAAITTADARIGQVLAAVQARPNFAAENWLFVVTSDHGGIGKGHGGQTPDERTIPFVISGGDVPSGIKTLLDVGQPAVAASVFRHLGLNIPSAWGWEEDGFVIGASMEAATGANSIFLGWKLPPEGMAGLVGFELRRDGQLVATLDPTVTSWVDTSPPAAASTVEYALRLLGTNEADLRASASVPNAELEPTEPVLHLRFDGDLSDDSGNGLDATAVGTPSYVAGFDGQALELSATDGALLGGAGLPELLQFGSDTDFTLSFWVRSQGGWSGDPVILSNKNWASGGNPGWAIAAELGGSNWQWNFKGDQSGRIDFDPSNAQIADDNWHLVTVTHDRSGNAVFYQDGVSIGTRSIASAGDVDTAFPIQIGRDGNGQYPFSSSAWIDDLKVWRRVLDPPEVSALAGQDPVVHLKFDGNLLDESGNDLHATAIGTPSYVSGVDGSALRLDATNGALLGSEVTGVPELLRFGSDTDFSLEFWFRCDGGWSGDPAILSNKSWASGGNQGWIVACQSGGTNWQWNFKGATAGRLDFDPSNAPIADGEWHRVVITHDRDGVASFYHDGQPIGTVDIAGAGDVDTANPIQIGRDGAGQYALGVPAWMDELKIWRRVLSPAEIGDGAGGASPFVAWMNEQAYLYGDPGPGELEPLADPDGDGSVNLVEFASGSNPLQAQQRPEFGIESGPDGSPRLVFLQRNGGEGTHGADSSYEVDGIRYLLESAESLAGPWETASVVQLDAEVTVGPTESNCHRMVVELPTGRVRSFWRLKVSQLVP